MLSVFFKPDSLVSDCKIDIIPMIFHLPPQTAFLK